MIDSLIDFQLQDEGDSRTRRKDVKVEEPVENILNSSNTTDENEVKVQRFTFFKSDEEYGNDTNLEMCPEISPLMSEFIFQ